MDPRPDSPGTAVLAKLESYLPAAIAALAVALGMWLRVSDLPSLLLFGDEYHSLSLSRSDYGHILTSFDFLGSGVALPLLQRMAMDLFGEGLFGVRLPAVLGGVLGLAAMYPVARNLVGHSAAAIATWRSR